MDSFLSLFDPGASDEVSTEQQWEGEKNGNFLEKSGQNNKDLPPEPQFGNIEYKLKLINPTRQRFEHLVTQMKWRLREGQGEAIYEIGVEDSGRLRGLSSEEMKASLITLDQMAMKLGATTTILRESIVTDVNENKRDRSVVEVLVRKIPDDQPGIDLRIAVYGGVDAGKSTLLGVLTQGELDDGRGRARLNMFKHLHEVKSGRTSSISHEFLGFDSQGRTINYQEGSTETICELSSKLVTLIDLAGHQKYLRTTIRGISGYSPHYILFVISSVGGFTKMTREHLTLAFAFQIPLIIVLSKTDMVTESKLAKLIEELEDHLLNGSNCKRVPFRILSDDDIITYVASKHSTIPIFSLSSVSGDGLSLFTRFLYLLPPGLNIKERERLEQDLPEFQIDETFRIPSKGTILGGLLTRGILSEGNSFLLGPMGDGTFKKVKVTSCRRYKTPCRIVRASQSASLGLNIEVEGLRKGMVLLSPTLSPESCLFFQADVCVLFHATTIKKGFQCTVHIGNVSQTAIIEETFSAKPLYTNDRANVVFRFIKQPEFIKIGARLLFREGNSKGIGTITHLYPLNSLLPSL